MLILTSNGISNATLMSKLQESLKSCHSKAVIITTASKFRGNLDENIKRHTEIYSSLGLSVAEFDSDVDDPDLLETYDLIFIMGGNPFYLLNSLNKRNYRPLFKRLIQTKIVIGASAGSLVFGHDLSYIFLLEPHLNESVHLEDFTGLGLTDIHIYPHTNNQHLFNENVQNVLNDFKNQNGIDLRYLKDGEAVFIGE